MQRKKKWQQIEYEADKQIIKLEKMQNKLRKFKEFCSMEDEQDMRERLIWYYDPYLKLSWEDWTECQQQFNTPTLTTQTKHNWIQEYLHPTAKITGIHNNLPIQIHNCIADTVQCTYQFSNEEVYIGLNEINAENKTLNISYPSYSFVHAPPAQFVRVRAGEKMMILLRIRSQGDGIRRLLLFRQEGERFFVVNGFYHQTDTIKPVWLEQGVYLLMSTSAQLELYSQMPLQHVSISSPTTLQKYNLMLGAFPPCHPKQLTATFTRCTDLSLGIIIEVYRNFSTSTIKFIDEQNHYEDKTLIFPSLYSHSQREGILGGGEIVIMFYEISAIPAVLYIPAKKVIRYNQEIETNVVHTIVR